jgi:WD40 repeat protein
LYSLAEKDTALLSLDFNLEGSLFAVGAEDKTIRIYDENMKTISQKVLPGGIYSSGHMSRINSVCFHKEELHKNLLLSGGWDQRVILYDIRTKKFQGTILGPYIMGDSIDVRDNYIMTGSYSPKYKIQVWDLRNLKLISNIPEISNEDTNIYSVQFSKNKNKLQYAFAGSSTNQLKVYEYGEDFKNNDLYLSTRFLDKPCYTLDYSNEGDFIAFSGADSNIRIINL